MKTSDTLEQLATALAAAQGGFVSAAKNRDVDVNSEKANYTFGYATLDAVLDMARPHLSSNGLSFVQSVDEEAAPLPEQPYNVIPRLTTRLMHSSGQWIESSLRMQVERGGNQGIGSAITYMRRYGIMALLGISTATDDDDGNAGDGNRASYRDRQPRGGKSQPYQQQEERREAPKAQQTQQTKPPANGSNNAGTSSATQTAAATSSTTTTDARPMVFDQAKPKELTSVWYDSLFKLEGESFALAVWKNSKGSWALRFDTLRDIVLACESIRKVMGAKPGSELIGSIVNGFTMDAEGLQQIRHELVRAGNGEVQTTANAKGA